MLTSWELSDSWVVEILGRNVFFIQFAGLPEDAFVSRRILIVFCNLLAFGLCGSAFARTNSISEDFILHCGSLYAMISEAQRQYHPDVARGYGDKFKILRKEIERKFENSETGREQARKEIQDKVYELSSGIVNLPSLVPKLIDNCDGSNIIKSLTEF